MRRLDGQVVWITGASAGIGEALARECAARGAGVALAARRVDRLHSIAEELTRQGRRALAVGCDVTNDEEVSSAFRRILDAYGRLDVLIANAGYGVVGQFETLSLADYQRQFDTNVFGIIRTLYAALPELKRVRGRIAIMSSIAGYIAAPGVSPYAMSKFALQALAGSLYHELAPVGVSVTTICPGFVESEIRRVDNYGRLQEDAVDPIPSWLAMSSTRAARQIVDAVLRRKPEVIITGHGKVIVWAKRYVPGIVRAMMSLSKGRGYRDLRNRRPAVRKGGGG